MTVKQLHDFLGVLITAGRGKARVETAGISAPLNYVECQSCFVGGSHTEVVPESPEEALAVLVNERINEEWVMLHSGEPFPAMKYSRVNELYDQMEARNGIPAETEDERLAAYTLTGHTVCSPTAPGARNGCWGLFYSFSPPVGHCACNFHPNAGRNSPSSIPAFFDGESSFPPIWIVRARALQ